MTIIRTIAAIALLSALYSNVHAQSKTVTFGTQSNPSALTIRLVDDQPVTISTAGNIGARCIPNTAGNQCADVPSGGGGGTGATASLSGGSIANGATGIAPGTQLQLTATTNGAVCLRRGTPTTAWGSATFGNALLNFGTPVGITLSQGSTQYSFDLQCYGDGGSSSIQTFTVTTGTGGGGGGGANCSSITAPPGFTRTGTTSFQQLPTTTGIPGGLFPQWGAGFGALGQNILQYTSIAFVVPGDITCSPGASPACRVGEFGWRDINLVNKLNDLNSYFTVSECPGDFRIPPVGNAPAGDPTFSQGCRNWRNFFSNLIAYRAIGWSAMTTAAYQPSTQLECNLEIGKTYYFNLILDGPADGQINTAGAANGCEVPGEQFCGAGVRYLTND